MKTQTVGTETIWMRRPQFSRCHNLRCIDFNPQFPKYSIPSNIHTGLLYFGCSGFIILSCGSVLHVYPYSSGLLHVHQGNITHHPTVYFKSCLRYQLSNHQSSALLREIHWWPADFPHKGPVMRKAFPCYDVIMECASSWGSAPSRDIIWSSKVIRK